MFVTLSIEQFLVDNPDFVQRDISDILNDPNIHQDSRVQKSASFLLPLLQLDLDILIEKWKFIKSYCGDNQYEKNKNVWGDNLYLHFDKVLVKEMEEIKTHPLFEDYYYPTEETTMVVFKLPEEKIQTVVKPFLAGKYSMIDKGYVNKYFPSRRKHALESRPFNFWICQKAPHIRKIWEVKIGVKIPKQAEVWSRPEMRDEIYKYEEEIQEHSSS